MTRIITKQGSLSSPALYWSLTKEDIEIVKRQMVHRKFENDIVAGVVYYCQWGAPQVLLCRPMVKKRPFPTSFWLTCPYLIQKCGELESQQGVKALEEYLQKRVSLHDWILYHVLHMNIRMSLFPPAQRMYLQKRRPSLWKALRRGGVGGIQDKNSFKVKCLHLHVASWLTLRTHPAGEWLHQNLQQVSCPVPECYPCFIKGGGRNVERAL